MATYRGKFVRKKSASRLNFFSANFARGKTVAKKNRGKRLSAQPAASASATVTSSAAASAAASTAGPSTTLREPEVGAQKPSGSTSDSRVQYECCWVRGLAPGVQGSLSRSAYFSTLCVNILGVTITFSSVLLDW
eukprot:scpid86528/ scgid13351/ 